MRKDHRLFLFVYGSLKRGFDLHHYLRDAEFLGEATTEPVYRLFNLGDYPGLITSETGGVCVRGEVYRVTAELLARLDEVEGVDEGYYVREAVRLQSPYCGDRVESYFYLRSVADAEECGTQWP